MHPISENDILIDLDIFLPATYHVPRKARGLVIFSHGSGSGRISPRNHIVAEMLNSHHLATLLTDLLTPAENEVEDNRFNITLLGRRLAKITEWARSQEQFSHLPVGYLGTGTGAAAALTASVLFNEGRDDNIIRAVVSRGGRPDLAGHELSRVKAPTLLIVGSLDEKIFQLNKNAYDTLSCEKKMETVEGASHLFEETGALNKVGELAGSWFDRFLWKALI